MVRLPAALTSAVLLALWPGVPASGAATHEVAVEDNVFTPDVVSGKVGDSVHWSRPGLIGNPHNVREDGEIFRSGDPIPGPIDFTATFSAGRFHYYCEVHGGPGGGMDGLIKVPPKAVAKPAGLRFTVRWAAAATNTGSVFDVQYRIGAGTWKTWKKDAAGYKGVFGKNGNPVKVKDGKTYRFRARSQEGDAVSRWSPKALFTP